MSYAITHNRSDQLDLFLLAATWTPESFSICLRSLTPAKQENGHTPAYFASKPKSNKDRIKTALKKYGENEIAALDAFNETLNREPREDQTDEVAVGGGKKAKYVPIEHAETFLDQVFQVWSTDNLTYSVEMNEVIVSLDVVVRHPITHDWVRRSGIGAAPIQQEKVHDPEDPKAKKGYRPARVDEFYQTKRINALHSAMPAAKSFAFNNAVKSLGERFGRNLNRDHRNLYKSIFTDLVEEEDEEEKRAFEYIDKHGPESAREAMSEEFLSNHPQVREKLEEDDA